jgi:hypothetical protein
MKFLNALFLLWNLLLCAVIYVKIQRAVGAGSKVLLVRTK